MTTTISVSGMTCGHCKKAVESALTDVNGVTAVEVNLDDGLAKVEGSVAYQELHDAIEEEGYEAKLVEAS